MKRRRRNAVSVSDGGGSWEEVRRKLETHKGEVFEKRRRRFERVAEVERSEDVVPEEGDNRVLEG